MYTSDDNLDRGLCTVVLGDRATHGNWRRTGVVLAVGLAVALIAQVGGAGLVAAAPRVVERAAPDSAADEEGWVKPSEDNPSGYRVDPRPGLDPNFVGLPGSDVPADGVPAGSARAARGAAVASSVPTNNATDEDKVSAARVLEINPNSGMLGLNDQEFVLALWRKAKPDTNVKAQALQAYLSSDVDAAYAYIKTGIFSAANADAQVEIAAERAKSLRRAAAVVVGLDPRDTALIEKNDRDFIFSMWQRVAEGSHVWTDAKNAIKDGSTATDWSAFIATGAKAAAEKDTSEAIARADQEHKAKLLAAQLKATKQSLLHLLQLPVTEEALNLPNREFVLSVSKQAKGVEVQLAAQAALLAPGSTMDKALHDFIFEGGREANTRDQDAAYAKDLAAAKSKVALVLDAAKRDGYQPNLVAAAELALKDPTLLSLQTFLLKGADAALRSDLPAPAEGMTILLKGAQSGRCAGVAGAVGTDAEKEGTAAVLFDCLDHPVRRWSLHKINGDNFALINVNSRRCLGVAKGGVANNDPIVQSMCNPNATEQQWRFEVLSNGLYQLRNVKSSRMLMHETSKTENRTPLRQYAMAGEEAANQQWRLIDVNHNSVNLAQSGRIQLSGVPSRRCIQVVDAVPANLAKNGTRIEIKDCKGQNLSLWNLENVGDNKYKLVNEQTKMCLDLMYSNAKNGAIIEQWGCGSSVNQVWVFQPGPDGSVKLISGLTGALVTVLNAHTNNGALLIGYGDAGGDNRLWTLTAR